LADIPMDFKRRNPKIDNVCQTPQSGILRMRFCHPDSLDADQIKTSASITSAIGVLCFTRNAALLLAVACSAESDGFQN